RSPAWRRSSTSRARSETARRTARKSRGLRRARNRKSQSAAARRLILAAALAVHRFRSEIIQLEQGRRSYRADVADGFDVVPLPLRASGITAQEVEPQLERAQRVREIVGDLGGPLAERAQAVVSESAALLPRT